MTGSVLRATRERAMRNKALAAVHIAKGQLGLDDDSYREVIRRVSSAHGAEVDSAARLDARQMHAVLEEFRRLGAKRPGVHKPARYPGRPHNFDSPRTPPMLDKIEAQLASMGVSWAYADAIAARQCGIARCAWVRDADQLRAIVAALDVEQAKRSANAFIDDAARRLGLGEKEMADVAAGMPRNWRRNRRCLKSVCDVLAARVEMLEQKERNA